VSEPKTVLDIADLPVRSGSGYPEHYAKAVKGRSSISLGNPLGLTQFGVNVTTLEPGAWSSQRHWHLNEDELVMALEGEMVVVDEEGRHPFKPGQVMGWKANTPNGHHIINEGDKPAKFLVVGTRALVEEAYFPDIDMHYRRDEEGLRFQRKDGTSF
jgi:uncharacterized cupin superfamily protein